MGRAIGRRLAAEGLRVELHDDHFPQGTPDVVWLTEVGKRGWIVLTKDTRIRSCGVMERYASRPCRGHGTPRLGSGGYFVTARA
jgi:hypothetical protein